MQVVIENRTGSGVTWWKGEKGPGYDCLAIREEDVLSAEQWKFIRGELEVL